MTADRLVSVIGLGFGDCGKGLCTDALVRSERAHTVVRFNGGAQAGHNVVLPDGRRHTFSQFGSGTFVPGVHTVLAGQVVVHPTALLEEARALEDAGVHDAMARLWIDPRCRVTTPFHQAAGRLREWRRGAGAHGSCGAGFGETVGHGLAHPDQVLRWGDLLRPGDDAEARLDAIRTTLREALSIDSRRGDRGDVDTPSDPAEVAAEWRILRDPGIAARWLALARSAARRLTPVGIDDIAERLARPGTLVYEGAQGMLLDEQHGFHPHTTWSQVGTAAVEAVAAEAGRPAEVVHLGVLRSYLTRHGAGPLPTEDAALDTCLPEPHNGGSGWQGRFRRGHADEVLLRYAVDAAGPLDGLVVTHLDAFGRTPGLRWCTSYRARALAGDDDSLCVREPTDGDRVVALHVATSGLDHGRRLGELLRRAAPEYEAGAALGADEFIARVEAATGRPVVLGVHGPTHEHVAARPAPGLGCRGLRPAAHNAARPLSPETPRP